MEGATKLWNVSRFPQNYLPLLMREIPFFLKDPKVHSPSLEGNPFFLRHKTPFPKLPPENLPLLRSEMEKGEGNPFFLRPVPHS
jgi:hypothetical protein